MGSDHLHLRHRESVPVTPSFDRDRAFAFVLIPLAVIAILGLVAPKVLMRNFGGSTTHKAPMLLQVFLRVAAVLLLIGAIITWYRIWTT
jgi:hypothetical protein